MPRILQMAEDFAERFNFEPARVAGIVKALREGGLIKAGPRGVNAPDCTPLDAARILIAMMLRVRHEDVAEGVSLFGAMQVARGALTNDAKAPESFEQSMAEILAFCGRDDTSWLDQADIKACIYRDTCTAETVLSIFAEDDDARWELDDFDGVNERHGYLFLHPEFSASHAADNTPTPELLAAWRKYRSGFHEVPTLTRQDFFEIGQVLAGHQPPKTFAK